MTGTVGPSADSVAPPSLTAVGAEYLASRSHEAAMESLAGAVLDHAPLLVLIGADGAGRSTVLRKLAHEMSATTAPVLCPASGLDFNQIVSFVCTDLRLGADGPDPAGAAGALAVRLGADGQRPVLLLVDDVDRVHGDALGDLLRLSQATERRRARLHLVLCGGPVLQQRLARAREMHPRIGRAVFARLTRLSDPEAETLVEGALTRRDAPARASASAAARRRIVELGEGLPGRLVALAHGAARHAGRGGEAAVEDVEAAARALREAPVIPIELPVSKAPEGAQPPARAIAAPAADGRRSRMVLTLVSAVGVVGLASLGAAVLLLTTAGRDTAPPVAARAEAPQASLAARPPVATHDPPVASAPDDGPGALAARQSFPSAPPSAPGPVDTPGPTAAAAPSVAPAVSLPALPDTGAGAAAVAGAAQGGAATRPPSHGVPPSGAPIAVPASTTLRLTDIRPSVTPTAASGLERSPAVPHGIAIDRAWAAFERKALSTPAQDNAVRWAEAALSVQPGSAAATDVLHAVVDTYLRWSNDNLARKRLSAASTYLERARTLGHYASPEQTAAMNVLAGEIASSRRGGGRYYMDAPRWLDDLDRKLRGLPLP